VVTWSHERRTVRVKRCGEQPCQRAVVGELTLQLIERVPGIGLRDRREPVPQSSTERRGRPIRENRGPALEPSASEGPTLTPAYLQVPRRTR